MNKTSYFVSALQRDSLEYFLLFCFCVTQLFLMLMLMVSNSSSEFDITKHSLAFFFHSLQTANFPLSVLYLPLKCWLSRNFEFHRRLFLSVTRNFDGLILCCVNHLQVFSPIKSNNKNLNIYPMLYQKAYITGFCHSCRQYAEV